MYYLCTDHVIDRKTKVFCQKSKFGQNINVDMSGHLTKNRNMIKIKSSYQFFLKCYQKMFKLRQTRIILFKNLFKKI